jgi:hypothetical protein
MLGRGDAIAGQQQRAKVFNCSTKTLQAGLRRRTVGRYIDARMQINAPAAANSEANLFQMLFIVFTFNASKFAKLLCRQRYVAF